MFALVCLLALCAHRGLVSCECATAVAGGGGGGRTECVDSNGAPRSDAVSAGGGRRVGSSFADDRDTGSGVAGCVDLLKQAWNADRMLRLNVLRSEENDTLVNVRFGANAEDRQNEVGRTFGLRRRMQLFLWLPISFKLGVIVTLLLVLTTMSLKSLILGFVILLLLLMHANGHGKLWGAPKAPLELADFHRNNVHIHVHTLPEDHHQPQTYIEPWHGSSPAAVYHV